MHCSQFYRTKEKGFCGICENTHFVFYLGEVSLEPNVPLSLSKIADFSKFIHVGKFLDSFIAVLDLNRLGKEKT